jgi:catechol 2,3-dioxygenase-like lactoylglutathione lyase family enzyme
MPSFDSIAPVFAVRDLDAALIHYDRLGFAVRADASGQYGFARRDDVYLHLALVPDVDPLTSTSAAYLYVDDADALHAEWAAAGVAGLFRKPVDTDYGLREGAHVDNDGNLLRYGSPLS